MSETAGVPSEITDAIERHAIEMSTGVATRNPFMPGDTSDMVHWFCNLSGHGLESFDFYLSFKGPAEPTLPAALHALSLDIKMYRGCAGYEDLLPILGLDDGEDRADLAVTWSELERLAPLLEQILDMAPEQAPARAPGM